MERSSNVFAKVVACILILALMAPIGVSAAMPAAIAPRASNYLAAYTAYICAMGDGELEIWFSVTGTRIWADIGTLDIFLYESDDTVNWRRVKTFQYTDYDDETMLAHNTFDHVSCVEYQGTPGKYYKAYVCVWAGSETDGDSRYFWTDPEWCT